MKKLSLHFSVMVTLVFYAVTATEARADGKVVIGGTGMGLALAREVAVSAGSSGVATEYEVLPSIGSSGGLRALGDGTIDLAIAARRLKPEEQEAGLRERVCLLTPLLFATERETPEGIAIADLPSIYSDPAPTWPDGTPLKVILRARSGSEMPYLASRVPGLEQAFETAFERPGVAIGVTDQINADLARTIEGSLAIMTLLQIRSENLDLDVIPLDGLRPSARTAADGSYPFPIKVCFVAGPEEPAGVSAFLRHLRSEKGREIVGGLGATLVD